MCLLNGQFDTNFSPEKKSDLIVVKRKGSFKSLMDYFGDRYELRCYLRSENWSSWNVTPFSKK